MIENGGEIVLTVKALSAIPVTWLHMRLDSPLKNIFGGGSTTRFTESPRGVWTHTRSISISEFAPSGDYTFSNIKVTNEGMVDSKVWDSFSFKVSNMAERETPVIDSVTINRDMIKNGGEVVLKVRVLSKIPVTWLHMRLDSPLKNIFGGGSTTKFTQSPRGVWTHTRTIPISKSAPSGKYIFGNLKVRNEGMVDSKVWESFHFLVDNG